MKNLIYKIIISVFFTILSVNFAFAAKYTIVNGKEFNNRIKLAINSDYNSSSIDDSITSFKNSPLLKGDPIDISEDGDSSVLAYIDDGTIYYVADEDIYLNEDASYMFDKFTNLKEVDLTYFNFVKTKKMNFMFSNCLHLDKLDMDNDTTIYLDEMQGMFFNCQSLRDLYIFMLNTKNVKNMNSLFYNCKNLQNIYINKNSWSINNTTNFNKMFYNCLLLKTNFNYKATNISESKYKVYAVAGDDYREGLLRDFDYDYDEIVYSKETIKIDKANDNLIEDNENSNIKNNINSKDIENSKKYLNVKVSSNSELFAHNSDDRINIDGKMNNNKYNNLDTLDDVPILRNETTQVDKLVPRKSSKSNTNRIAPLSDNNIDESMGLLRPSYNNTPNIEPSSIEIDDKVLEPEEYKTDFISQNIQNILIFLFIIMIIAVGIIVFNKKDKNENIDF